MSQNLRSPIVITVGHIDHGKTSLLDAIRGTAISKSEVGELTQHIGATFIPRELIERICKELLEKMKIKLEVPGLLFIDTPGHSAFIGMRKKVGPISDLAILVVDINEGFKEQTIESLRILKEFKIPFLVVGTKIDKISFWKSNFGFSFLESLKLQKREAVEELDRKVYKLVETLAEFGFDSERFDRIKYFTKQISIVPVSSVNKEGIQEVILVLAGLAQRFLKGNLIISDETRGIVLEVKNIKGVGEVIDCIIYDGKLEVGNLIAIGGKEVKVTKVRGIFLPETIQDIRAEKKFKSVNKVSAACGVRLFCTDLENVIAGSPLVVIKDEKEVEKVKNELVREMEDIIFNKNVEGVCIRADTIGSLEALIKILGEEKIEIKKSDIGLPKKEDFIEMQNIRDDSKRVILIFNLELDQETIELSKKFNVKVFSSNIIYRLIEEYKEWVKNLENEKVKQLLEKINRPVKLKVLEGCIFRKSKPCIFGVEILAGYLKPNTILINKNGNIIGKVKEIQREGVKIDFAITNDKVAISIEEAVYGKNFIENDILYSKLTKEDIEVLKKYLDKISLEERKLIEEYSALVA